MAVFSANRKSRYDARANYPQKFFQPPRKPVMMRTRGPQGIPAGPFFQRAEKSVMMRARVPRKVFSAARRFGYDARASTSGKFFQRLPESVMMRARAPREVVFPATHETRYDARAQTQKVVAYPVGTCYDGTDVASSSRLEADMARWIDYEPYADRSVAEFRAKREMCGLSLYDVADELGVAVNTVKRWENPNYFPPSPDAWRFIDHAYDKHCDAVEESLRETLATAGDGPVTVLWYRNGMRGVSDAQVGEHNAVAKAVAESLLTLGREVSFRWSDPDAEEAQREATSSFYRRTDPDMI